jgi:hypothetical protein
LGIYEVPLHRTLNLVQTLIGYFVYTLLANRKIMNELLKLLKMYEEKNSENLLRLVIYSDGSGYVCNNYEYEIFSFDNLEEFENKIKE